MNNINHNYESSVANKDVKEGGVDGITLTYINNTSHNGKDEAFDVFALPGSTVINGLKSITGRKNAVAMARRYLSNPKATFKMKPAIEALADKIVTRIECSMRDDSSIMGA